MLLFAAQASHELLPPDVLESVVSAIVNNFVTERNSAEVMAVGWGLFIYTSSAFAFLYNARVLFESGWTR
jgi:protein SDA1